MRSNLEFRWSELSDAGSDEAAPRAQEVAQLLADELPRHGFDVSYVSEEDWGWRVTVANQAFPLWIGCGHYEEYDDGFLCFIEPRTSSVRRFLKRLPTTETVERLATAIERIIQESGKAHHIRWWTDDENVRG
jgi:hypothetical protein